MASFDQYFSLRKSLVLYLLLFLFTCNFSSTFSQPHQKHSLRRTLVEEELKLPTKKTNVSTTISTTKNQTKLIKPNTTNSTKSNTNNTLSKESKLVKQNVNSTSKSSNSTKPIKTSFDLSKYTKLNIPKNKTQPIITKKPQKTPPLLEKKTLKQPKVSKPSWMDLDDDDLVTEFRDLPSKFQKSLLPDLDIISTTSKAYITKANQEITEGFKPLVGKHYAPTIAFFISSIFVLAPLLIFSLIFNKIKAYFSLQKILIFIQAYLAIYFMILSTCSLVTGLEPLKFFYSTSQTSYIFLQVLQTLGYVLYLLVLLMYLVLVFSTETGLGLKVLGLSQAIVGFAVGLHYYVSVFHRAILHQAPKTNWKIHGVYATCFVLIFFLAGAERRKKAYSVDDGEEGKKS